ncbi:hypothetical protein AYL99_01345 [Fonsecaea erecta]|uniref:Uncharacterized protein n=1 Tax=Fonsecaea erecta TaxID=1367422 RepID=A0A179A1W8_9EURO|nr:hypothetical protein AYL99_01345 [Fonsecaea erecta]OAP65373.1 hypothetical protein AYL99_01345 [Fonsecaea erecta]
MANLDLPAFGIRDLNGPTCPPGIVQITASQYDSTIHSQPDAVLSYIDHDDGELITVGSSLELQQRLEEPVPPSVALVPPAPQSVASLRGARETKENSLVHIFDIRHTGGSLAVWRHHEAYTTKKLRDQESSSSSSRSGTRVSSPHRPSSSGPQPRLTFDTLEKPFSQNILGTTFTLPPQSAPVSDPTMADDGRTKHTSTAQPVIPGEGESLMQTEKAPESASPCPDSQLGPLADFLESTAEGLRKLAEKTRDADTSAVENVLFGFKNILKEAGELGLGLLATIMDQELETIGSNKVETTDRPGSRLEAQQTPRAINNSVTEDKVEVVLQPHVKRFSFGENRSNGVGTTNRSCTRVRGLPFLYSFGATKKPGEENKLKLDVRPAGRFGPVKNRSNGINTTGRPFHEGIPICDDACVPEPSRGEDKVQPDIQPSEKRVSFVETTHPAPPQTTLRSKVYEVKKESSTSEVQTSSLPSSVPPTNNQQPSESPYSMPNLLSPSLPPHNKTGGRTESVGNSIIDSQPSDADVLARFPALKSLGKVTSASRFEDFLAMAGTFRDSMRTKSALSRYPSISQLEECSKANPSIDLDSKTHSDGRWERLYRPPVRPVPQKINAYKKPTVDDEEEPVRSQREESAGKIKAPGLSDTFSWSSYSLPGAWPQPKSEQQSEPKREAPFRKESPATAGPSNIYQGLPQWQSEGNRSSIFGAPPRFIRPDDMIYPRGPVFLRKAQTVSGTNPAARLNGPFDPLAHIPALQPRPQRSQPELSSFDVVTPDIRVKRGFSYRLPQRSQTLHHTDRYKPRDAAPYENPTSRSWEDYLENSRNTTPNSRVAPQTRFSAEPGYRPDPPAPSSLRAPRATRLPSFTGYERPMQLLQQIADQNEHSPSVGSLPSHPQPLETHRPETIRAGPPQVKSASKPSPPLIPAPPPAAVLLPPAPAATNISRSSSILSPIPPAPPHPPGRVEISPPSVSSKKVDECVRALKAMGFGRDDPIEFSRLGIYAAAAEGYVGVAIQLLEDDRAAAKELGKKEHVDISRDLEKEADVEKNPWEE